MFVCLCDARLPSSHAQEERLVLRPFRALIISKCKSNPLRRKPGCVLLVSGRGQRVERDKREESGGGEADNVAVPYMHTRL
jgi:hypothetical protein